MDYNYPLLKKVFNHYKKHKKDVSDIYLVCCQHLLEPQSKMFELFVSFGFNPSKIIVLGKVYSTNNDILNEIRQIGIKVLQPKFSSISFDDEHRRNCKKVLGLVPVDSKVIILDDGAELIQVFIGAKREVIFAVEQTSSGFRKLEKDFLPFPVVNVARSTTKLVQESPLVARQCFELIGKYILENKINKPSILVVGLGPIGEAILEIFEQNQYIVSGFDIKHRHSDLVSVILNNKPNVIIGATGSSILQKEDITNLISNKLLYLISVSSSDREFPVVSFRKGGEIHEDIVYKNITFANNGFPITFKGNRNELTPVEIEKTICLLSGAVIDGIVNDIKKPGLINVSEKLEKMIN